jgi:hypothetical protein
MQTIYSEIWHPTEITHIVVQQEHIPPPSNFTLLCTLGYMYIYTCVCHPFILIQELRATYAVGLLSDNINTHIMKVFSMVLFSVNYMYM